MVKGWSALLAVCLGSSGCSAEDPRDYPDRGGVIIKESGRRYTLAVKSEDGSVARAKATLDEGIEINSRWSSIGGQYRFFVEKCGYLTFVKPAGSEPAVVMYDDADTARNSPDCPIDFFAMKHNEWKLR